MSIITKIYQLGHRSSKLIVFLVIFSMLIMPVFSFAAGLVPCTNTPDPVTGVVSDKCDFNALMTLINTVINFIFVSMVIPIAAIMFVYAGFLLVSSGGSSEARVRAKNIFTNAVIGLVIALAAWLLVKTILSVMGYNGAWIISGFS